VLPDGSEKQLVLLISPRRLGRPGFARCALLGHWSFIMLWHGMVWCPSYPWDRNRCDQVVAAGSGAS
jgi:hypothetical protein